MELDEFRIKGYEIIDWIADYFQNIESFPVKSRLNPGDVIMNLQDVAPAKPESFDRIMSDFNKKILPGITHWQHPNFHAYFPANNSYPSILAEMLTSAIGAQCMMWQTSPAAAELEEVVMNWLKQMMGLPDEFSGVIQDTASTATLVSILTAREKISDYSINNNGFLGNENFRVYCSTEAHSSIEKAVKIAGIGKENLVKVPVGDNFELIPEELDKAIEIDIINGYKPLCVVAAIGTTGSTAVDPLKEIGEICEKYSLWLHVDAAFAGSALLLPEFQYMLEGIEYVDTFVFNPHKWLFTNFDCSAYFVRDKEALIKTFEILPEYLKTGEKQVNNYKDWGIQLGRRFRALKLWFVIRSFGVSGLQEKLRYHIKLANELKEKINYEDDFELMASVKFNVICFRYKPADVDDTNELNELNESILKEINDSGKLFMTHTKLNGKYVMRFVIAQTNVTGSHVEKAWELIKGIARKNK
jgi:aromatic-L-amino-acid decarboxylase